MATIRKEILTKAATAAVWDAVRDVGALHTQRVPGFVKDTRLEGAVRVVTFGNGLVTREPIVTLDEGIRRLVWTVEGGLTSHYNSSVQVFEDGPGRTRIVWQSDFLPDSVATGIDTAMTAGAETMRRTLDRTAEQGA